MKANLKNLKYFHKSISFCQKIQNNVQKAFENIDSQYTWGKG